MNIAYMAEMGFHTVYLFIFVFPSYELILLINGDVLMKAQFVAAAE